VKLSCNAHANDSAITHRHGLMGNSSIKVRGD
jgi:hypothetical protein